eukprot:4766955-Amphidinium_carterae.1
MPKWDLLSHNQLFCLASPWTKSHKTIATAFMTTNPSRSNLKVCYDFKQTTEDFKPAVTMHHGFF